MDKRTAISLFVGFARQNSKAARQARKDGRPSMSSWLEGRADAYITAARILSGRAAARDRNARKVAA